MGQAWVNPTLTRVLKTCLIWLYVCSTMSWNSDTYQTLINLSTFGGMYWQMYHGIGTLTRQLDIEEVGHALSATRTDYLRFTIILWKIIHRSQYNAGETSLFCLYNVCVVRMAKLYIPNHNLLISSWIQMIFTEKCILPLKHMWSTIQLYSMSQRSPSFFTLYWGYWGSRETPPETMQLKVVRILESAYCMSNLFWFGLLRWLNGGIQCLFEIVPNELLPPQYCIICYNVYI